MTEVDVREAVRSELAEHVPPRLLSKAAAGRALGVSERMVENLIRAGELRSVKLGKRRLVPVVAIDEFVDAMAGAA